MQGRHLESWTTYLHLLNSCKKGLFFHQSVVLIPPDAERQNISSALDTSAKFCEETAALPGIRTSQQQQQQKKKKRL